MSTTTPTLGELLEAAIRGELDGVRVSLPGVIQVYDSDARRATVQVTVTEGVVGETNERREVALAPFTDVPVLLTGSGDVRIKFPIKRGDPCWLSFSSSSIARLKATDATKVTSTGDDRHHHEADAVAIPMPRWAGSVESAPMVEFTEDSKILAGGAASLALAADATALKSALDTFMTSLASAISGIPTGGAAAATAITAAQTAFDATLASWPTGTTTLKGS